MAVRIIGGSSCTQVDKSPTLSTGTSTTRMSAPSTVNSVRFIAPRSDETYTQTYEQISERIVELEAIGGSRILMQGGVNPELPMSWYTDLLRHLRILTLH